jgi:hypothetical protein
VLAAGLCFVPAAVGDAGNGHGPQHNLAAYAAPAGTPVQSQVHGGDQGGGWGGSHDGPGPGQGQGQGQGQGNGWGDNGGADQGQGQSHGGGWGDGGNQGSGSAQPATPQVAVPATPTPAAKPASPATAPASHGGDAWGGSHGNGQGASASQPGRHEGWGATAGTSSGNGNGNGHGNGNSSSGSSATPAASKSSSSSSSSSSNATPAVTTAASSSSASSAPASSAPAASAPAAPVSTTPVAVSVNPAQPAPTTPSAPSKATPRRGSGVPTGKRSQKASSRPGSPARSRTVTGAAGSGRAAARSPFRGLTGTSRALTHGFGSTAGSAAATPATRATRRPRRHQAAASSLAQPFNTLGHELSSVPTLVNGLVPLPVPDWSKPIIFALLLVCVLLALRAWLTGHRARRLETQREQLAADLASIQAALIPAIPATLGGLDVSVAYRPADGPGAGGDFYDAFALDADRVAIIVGDVSGHGREALGRAAHMHYTLRAYVEMGLEPRAALKLAGRVLGSDQDDLFTTVAVAVHDAAAGTLTYATAGHPAPVLQGPGAHEPLTRCASPALGWGVATGRRQTTVPFPEGARACFFTDGVTEARVDDELFGRDRLAGLLRALGPHAGAQELLEAVQRQAPAVHDDMAACIVAATTGFVGSELRTEELEVDLAQIGSGQAERFLDACGVTPAETEAVIAEAREIAAQARVALLRVEVEADEARATVTGPAPGRSELQEA